MVDKDLETLRQLLREAVDASRMYNREYRGRPGDRAREPDAPAQRHLGAAVRHLLAFARLLKIPPAELLEVGCPDAARTAQHHLMDWLGPDRRREARDGPRLPSNQEELTELIRSVVREEIAALQPDTNLQCESPDISGKSPQ